MGAAQILQMPSAHIIIRSAKSEREKRLGLIAATFVTLYLLHTKDIVMLFLRSSLRARFCVQLAVEQAPNYPNRSKLADRPFHFDFSPLDNKQEAGCDRSCSPCCFLVSAWDRLAANV